MYVISSSPYHKNLHFDVWSLNYPKIQNHLLSYVLMHSVELEICIEMESVLIYHKQECNITSSEDIVCAVAEMTNVQYQSKLLYYMKSSPTTKSSTPPAVLCEYSEYSFI